MAIENLFTLGKIYNATVGALTASQNHDWYGGYGSRPYPPTLRAGEKGWFLHLGSVAAAPPARSSGAIIYRGQTTDRNDFDWIVAWDNQIDSPKKVYTLVRPPVPADWGQIQQELINSPEESTSNYYGLLAHVSIDDGNFPVLRAVLSPQVPATN